MTPIKYWSIVKILLKLQYWKDFELAYGFYLRRSYFSWGETLDRKGQGLCLMFAFKNKDYRVLYL